LRLAELHKFVKDIPECFEFRIINRVSNPLKLIEPPIINPYITLNMSPLKFQILLPKLMLNIIVISILITNIMMILNYAKMAVHRGFLQAIRAAYAILLKDKMNTTLITQREEELVKLAFKGFSKIKGIHILADNITDRFGVFSFWFEDIHFNLIVKLAKRQIWNSG